MPKSVLFLCGLNCVRSPMAEQIARKALGDRVFIASAGLSTGEPDPFVEVVLDEIGLKPAAHAPRSLDDLDDTYFDVVIALTDEARAAAEDAARGMATDVEYWPVHDPTGTAGSREQVLDAYRAVRDDLARRIGQRFSAGAA
ncbi:MAG: low molecular weight phosphatase family protein [Rhizobiaceae bacterium]